MKKHKGKLLFIFILILVGCSREGNKAALSEQNPSVRTLTDVFGRLVELPEKVTTAAAVGGAARIMTYAGCADILVGVTDMDKKNLTAMPYSVVNADFFSSLPSVGSGGSNDTVYVEQLVEINPDVIIAFTSEDTVRNIAEKTGIPTIGLYPQSMFDESFFTALEIIGKVAGTEDHCSRVIEFIKNCQSDLNSRTADIADSEKPTVYTGAVSFRGAHGFEGTYANYPPFTSINARNVVDETGEEGAFLVDLEKIMDWDPDIVFLNPINMYLVNDDYEKNRSFYEELSAVREGRIYSQISYNYNWTNMEIAIADAYYAGKIIFPNQFSDIDPAVKADEIFTQMLGVPFYDKLAAENLVFGSLVVGE